MSAHLFTYGTLELPEVFAAVTGQLAKSVPAKLPGYARYCLQGEAYPGIIAAPEQVLWGTLYRDLEPAIHKQIDHYEETCYTKQQVTVITEQGNVLSAMAYVIPHEKRHLLSSRKWNRQEFVENHLENFLRYLR